MRQQEGTPVAPFRLDARRALITGAARGIGAAIAHRFASVGAIVALLDADSEVKRLAAELGGHGYVVDLADPDATAATTSAAIEALGGVDILVNNAGILRITPLLDITVAEWDEVFHVNTRSMLVTTQVAARAMIDAGTGGRIINMASMGGKRAAPHQAHYAASKAAVIALTQATAASLGEHGITANSLCPGYVLTEMGAATRTPEMVAAWSATSPLGRCADVDDVSAMALFLASDEASYCTGQALNVAGGMIVH